MHNDAKAAIQTSGSGLGTLRVKRRPQQHVMYKPGAEPRQEPVPVKPVVTIKKRRVVNAPRISSPTRIALA